MFLAVISLKTPLIANKNDSMVSRRTTLLVFKSVIFGRSTSQIQYNPLRAIKRILAIINEYINSQSSKDFFDKNMQAIMYRIIIIVIKVA